MPHASKGNGDHMTKEISEEQIEKDTRRLMSSYLKKISRKPEVQDVLAASRLLTAYCALRGQGVPKTEDDTNGRGKPGAYRQIVEMNNRLEAERKRLTAEKERNQVTPSAP